METIIITTIITLVVVIIYRRLRKDDEELVVFKPTKQVFEENSRENKIAKTINTVRLGSSACSKNLTLDRFTTMEAKLRSEYIDLSNDISHNGAGKAFLKLKEKGSDGSAEIIAYGYNDPKNVIGKWLDSKSHYKALMNPEFDYFGVGCKLDENNKWIDVVLFVDEKYI